VSAILLFGGLLVPQLLVGRIRHVDAAPLLCLPLLLLAAQTPLWIMRIWFRWRIAHREDAACGRYEPIGIGGLLLAMAAVALALAAARLSRSIGSSRGDGSIGGLVVGALVIVAVSAATVLPAVLAGLRARRLFLAIGLAFAPGAAIVVGYVALGIMRGDVRLDGDVFIAILALTGGFSGALIVPMLIARRLGYRLLWGRG